MQRKKLLTSLVASRNGDKKIMHLSKYLDLPQKNKMARGTSEPVQMNIYQGS